MPGKFRITYNAPVVLTFALAAVAVHVAAELGGESIKRFFVAYPNLDESRAYLGLFSHILGHANWTHLLANFSIILLIGPILEERHGSLSLLIMIAITALVTGIVNAVFMNTLLLGASGIVFMMILLASVANIRQREIPLTFVVIAVLYLGREVVNAFRDDQISQMAHLIGGVVGAALGFLGAGGAKAAADGAIVTPAGLGKRSPGSTAPPAASRPR